MNQLEQHLSSYVTADLEVLGSIKYGHIVNLLIPLGKKVSNKAQLIRQQLPLSAQLVICEEMINGVINE